MADTRAGDVEKSKSLALSLYHVDGAKNWTTCNDGDSSMTPSLSSYGSLADSNALLPVVTQMLP